MGEIVLVLGAGVYQLPLIDRYRSKGFAVAVASIPGNYPGIDQADRFFPVDTRDCKELESLARELGVCAVATAGTDVAMRSLGRLCTALGLHGPSEETAILSTNKYLMKEAFKKGGVRTSDFIRLDKAGLTGSERLPKYPFMVKCVDSSGSRGIAKVNAMDDLPQAVEESIAASRQDYCIAEGFVEGAEIGIDGYVDQAGDIVFLAAHDKTVYDNGSTNVPIGHRISSGFLDGVAQTDAYDQVQLAVDSLCLKDAFFNMDMILSDGKGWVIEMGARVGGTCIPEVIGSYFGFDYYDKILEASLGARPSFQGNSSKGATEGRLVYAHERSVIIDAFDRTDAIMRVSSDYPVGTVVNGFLNGSDRIGQIVGHSEDAEELSQFIDSELARIQNTCLAPAEGCETA